MDHLLKTFALYCGLSQSQYWHLRLLSSILFVPSLGVLYLAFFGKRERPSPPVPLPNVSLSVNSEGRLIALPTQQVIGIREPRYQ